MFLTQFRKSIFFWVFELHFLLSFTKCRFRHSVLLQLMFTSRFSWLSAKNKSRLTWEKKFIWERIYATISAFSSKQYIVGKLVTRWFSRYYRIFLIYGIDKYAKLEKKISVWKAWKTETSSFFQFYIECITDEHFLNLWYKINCAINLGNVYSILLSIKTRSLETHISPEKKFSAQINEFKINSKILCSAMMLAAAITMVFVIFWRQFGRWHVWPHRLLVEDWQRIKIALDVNVRKSPLGFGIRCGHWQTGWKWRGVMAPV